jgi:hypothetical protein
MLRARTAAQCRKSRFAFAEAARKLNEHDVRRLIVMFPLGRDAEPRIASFRRSRLLMALAYAPKSRETISFLELLLDHDSRLTRAFAAATLGMMGINAKSSGTILSNLVDNYRDPTVKYAAWRAVREITPRKATTKARFLSSYWRRAYAVPDWCTVYTAEEWLQPQTSGKQFKSLAEVDSWLRTVFHDSWLRKRFRELHWYSFELHDGRGSCCATGDFGFDVCHLTLPRFARNQLIILHELSHSLAIAADKHDGHRRNFCRIYLMLVGHFLDRAASEDLRLNLRTFDHAGECL